MNNKSPESPSGLLSRILNVLRYIDNQLKPQPWQLGLPSTSQEEVPKVIEQPSGSRSQFGEYVEDFNAAAQEIRNNHWPFPRP